MKPLKSWQVLLDEVPLNFRYITFSEATPIAEQTSMIYTCDMGGHGAGLMHSVFMYPGSDVIESYRLLSEHCKIVGARIPQSQQKTTGVGSRHVLEHSCKRSRNNLEQGQFLPARQRNPVGWHAAHRRKWLVEWREWSGSESGVVIWELGLVWNPSKGPAMRWVFSLSITKFFKRFLGAFGFSPALKPIQKSNWRHKSYPHVLEMSLWPICFGTEETAKQK